MQTSDTMGSMSIKIYSAYRVDLQGKSLFQFSQEVREFMRPRMTEAVLDEFNAMAIRAYYKDQLRADGMLSQEDKPVSPWRAATKELDDYKENYDFSLILYTDPGDPQSQWTYIMPFGGNQWTSVFETYLNTLKAESFGYWNNTEAPEEVTGAQWAEREAIWTRIGLLDDLTPIECGLSVSMFASSWIQLLAYSPGWGAPEEEAKKSFERVIQQDKNSIQNISQTLATSVDVEQTYPKGEEVSTADVVRFMWSSARDEIREELAQKIQSILTVPTWKDLISRPQTS